MAKELGELIGEGFETVVKAGKRALRGKETKRTTKGLKAEPPKSLAVPGKQKASAPAEKPKVEKPKSLAVPVKQKPAKQQKDVKKEVRAASPAPEVSNLGVMPLEGTSLISTRRPNEKNFAVFGNPDEVLLTQTGEGMKLNPKAFARAMDLLTDEPFMADMKGMSPEAIYEEGVRRGADNLKFIAEDLMDPETATASMEWYPTANRLGRDFASRINKAPEAGWAGLAATSPQTPWPVNVARIDRMSQMMGDQFDVDPSGLRSFLAQQEAITDPTKRLAPVRRGLDYVDRIARSDFDELEDPMDLYSRIVLADKSRFDQQVPNILPSGELGDTFGAMTWGNSRDLSNALSMMQNPSMENIRSTLTGGGKVPSFYNDIADPDLARDIITADTHSTGATGLFPAGANDTIATRGMGMGMTSAATGSKGYYGLISDAHNLAAKELGVPRGNAVQSITWEGVRDLWGSNAKTEALKNAVADIWRNSSSPDEARFRIAELMGRPVRRMFQVK